MRAVVQRVTGATVTIDGKKAAETGPGLLVLVAAHREDTEQNAMKLADRVAGMRVFNDENGKMNLSSPLPTKEQGGDVSKEVLVVSNFTLLGDTSQRRPSFVASAPYEQGEALYNSFVQALKAKGLTVQTGVYGADMKVELTNDGPVTLIVDA